MAAGSGAARGGRAGRVTGPGQAGDLGDLAVVGVGDVEVVGALVDGDAVGGVQLGGGRGGAVGFAAGGRGAAGRGGGVDDGGDGPGRGDLADGVVAAVGEEDVAAGVLGGAAGLVQRRGACLGVLPEPKDVAGQDQGIRRLRVGALSLSGI